jgi:hypothetical protein
MHQEFRSTLGALCERYARFKEKVEHLRRSL